MDVTDRDRADQAASDSTRQPVVTMDHIVRILKKIHLAYSRHYFFKIAMERKRREIFSWANIGTGDTRQRAKIFVHAF